MADLNALIAQGAKFDMPSPINQMVQMQALQQGQQQNQMNQMKMQESQRGQQEMNALRGIMSRPGFDLSTPESQRDVYNVAPTLAENLIKGHLGNVKIMGEASNLKLTGQKLAIEAAAEKEKHLAQMYRDISGRPSDANITAHAEDVAASPLYTPEEKARVAAKAQSLLELPMADRTAMLSGQGISAGELSTAATAKAGQGVTMRGQDIVAGTAAAGQDVTRRGQDIVASTAKAGQGVTLRGQDLVDARERQNIALRQETQRREGDPAFKQQMAQAMATGQAIAKDQALAQQVLPKVLDTAEQTLSQIDNMIGKRDKEGNLLKGQAPHPGFANAVGAGFPGARFIPGTPAADFQSRFDQVKGGAFLQAFETLKGGGSISNVEGEKGTAALNRMNLAQSEKEFVNAAREFQGIVRKGVERAKVRVGGNAPAAPTEVNFGDLK
jgi:hypothetical protein